MLRILRFSVILSVIFVGWLSLTFSANAQVYREEYGRNRIQYKYFDWQFIESNNFQVYYYDGGADLAQKSIAFLETEFSRITELLGYFPYSKTRVFLYNSIADKQQSNVGVHGEDFTIGGQTIFIKSQVEVAFSGDYVSYTAKLVFEVSDMLVEEMLFGGNIAEMFQSSLANPIPVWFTKGIASYVAYGWSKEMDDLAREYLSSEVAIKFSKAGEETSALLGQSIWNFTAQTYGQRSVSNILNLARIVRDEESSVAKTLGIPYSQFMDQWKAYYINMNNNILEGYIEVSDAKIVSSKYAKSGNISDIKFNPQGTLLAYAVAEAGKYEVRVINMQSNDELVLQKGGQRLIDQEINQNYPLLSWVDEFTLGIVSYEEGRNIVRIKRVGAKGEQVLNIPSLAQIQSFEFKEGGKLAAMTGVVDGRSDAFLFLVNRGSVRRISNDYYDDKNISFLPGSNVVVFASNRTTDSLSVTGPTALKNVNTNQFNLYTYDVDAVDSVYGKLTNSLSVESNPVAASMDQLYYLSDQQGINNLYRHIISDSLSIQLSNYNIGIKDFSLDNSNARIAFVSLNNGRDAVYVESLSAFQSIFTPGTPRRQQENIKILAEIRRKRLIEAGRAGILPNAATILESVKEPKRDSLKAGAIDTDNYAFKNESKIDSKNYKFETNDSESGQKSFLSIYKNRRLKNEVEEAKTYEPRFQTNNLVTSFAIDEIRSFSQLLEIQMTDYLENHRLRAGALVPYNFNSGYDVFLEYDYLKEAIDLQAKYYRKSIVLRDNTSPQLQRYNLNRFEVGAALPYSANLRFEVSPFYTQTKYIDLDYLLILNSLPGIEAERTASYLGFNAGVIFDNTTVQGTNVHDGTRAKITYEAHYKANKDARSFNNLEVDVRHYERVSKGIYLAGRFYFGRYGGAAPKSFLLGGVDNWAFNQRESVEGTEPDPFLLQTLNDNSDILFNQFTNLRGYDYNTFQGTNVMTFSGELRLPINQFFLHNDVKSNFVRNLQFIGFYDIGTAWTDISPFKAQNNVNTEEIVQDGSPFSAVINNFSNPWLQSTGFGIRTMLFGFYSRLDLSWPIKDFEVRNPKFQISLGYDF